MKFLVGSQYFFTGFEGFHPKDIDILYLEDSPQNYDICRQLTGKGKCIFYWRRLTPDDFIEHTLHKNLPIAIGKFLVPEFSKEIGFTIDHLKKLLKLAQELDDKHKYEKIIFDFYIQNGDFFLTKDQLDAAYAEYKKYR